LEPSVSTSSTAEVRPRIRPPVKVRPTQSAAVAPCDAASLQTDRGWTRHRLRRADVVLAVVFCGAALLARWPFILRGETLLHSDEAIVGLMAQDIAEGTRLPIYFYGQRYMGALESYVIAGLSPLIEDPIIRLRLGPALFFAAFLALQYLMLTRWFGRSGGLMGGLVLLAAAPMFVQWSISARGGYVEVLLWGTMLWWAYSEWFIGPARSTRRTMHLVILGWLIGSGFWINPTISVFVAPVVVHALLHRPSLKARHHPRLGRWLRRLDRAPWGLPLALPLIVLALVAVLTSLSAVWVGPTGVQRFVLLNLLPPSYAFAVLGVLLIAGAGYLICRTRAVPFLRAQTPVAGRLLLGVVAGFIPAIIYLLQRTWSGQGLDGSVPLGFRPLWTVGETLSYLFHGLPVLFGADASPFLRLVCTGRVYEMPGYGTIAAVLLPILNWTVFIAALTVGFVLATRYRTQVAAALRLSPGPHSPVVFLALALLGLTALYLLGGCSFDFNTIRYLIPVWAILPGLMAAACTSGRFRKLGRSCVLVVMLAWTAGQVALWGQLGSPHPLRGTAVALQEQGVDVAKAEIFDAHLLSFLTQQRPKVAEYAPFWSRLAHYNPAFETAGPVSYVVLARQADWTAQWRRTGWPGKAPPETQRNLWPRLNQVLMDRPADVLTREPLTDGYELWTLRTPLPE